MRIRHVLLGAAALVALSATMTLQSVPAIAAEKLKVSFAEDGWDGKSIPSKQVCAAQGGDNPHSPKLNIGDIPSGAAYVLVTITDEDAGDAGQHGIFKMSVPAGASSIVFPAIHETAKSMPAGVAVEKNEGWGMSKEGHYLPPCSNGRNHSYYSGVAAYDASGKKVGSSYIEWGRY